MKTYNHLFEKVVDKDNIRKAILKAARGKRRKATVRKTLKHIDEAVEYLHNQLVSGTWRPVEIHQTKEINDGVELKKRYIVCPSFLQEQCVHHAIMNICEPLFRKKFYHYSCGSVKNRGAELAKSYLEKMIQGRPKATKYVAKLDIRKFFHNVRPSFILREIRKTIKDKRVIRLFVLILRANKQIVNGVVVKRGIPIGFYTSPIFANIILDHIDHFVKEACGMEVYVRYMDDMILFSPNRRRLKTACLKVSAEVKRLGMVLKPVWQIHKLSSVLFLGYHFKRYCTKLRDRIFLKAVRLVRRIKAKGKITVHDCLRALSYLGRFKSADTYPAFVKYVSRCVNARELRKRVSNCFKKKGVYKNAFC